MEQAIASTRTSPPAPLRPDAPTSPTRPRSGARLLYIDNIRWVMIMLVLSMHAAVTYSGHGSWYVKESAQLGLAQDLTFVTYQVFLQSFFMGFLFFIAGYFVPGAFDKKGPLRFLKDRGYRLGLPALLFMLVINPLTLYYAAGILDKNDGFFGAYGRYISKGYVLYGTGPLWFCVALLFFCLVYAGYRALFRPMARPVTTSPFPRNGSVALLIAAITLATFLVRIPWPNGTSFYNMQFCYFSQYVAFFIAGTLAYRHNWLSTMSKTMSKRWGFIGLFGGLAIWLTLVATNVHAKTYAPFDGGWHWQSLSMCLVESLAGTGISLGILGLFREKFNRQGRWAAFFSASAFAVYVFHTPILIVITRLMTDLHWLPLLKFVLATVLCIVVTYALSAFVFRRLPLLKNIL
jgi:glucan biosynthesis protein C